MKKRAKGTFLYYKCNIPSLKWSSPNAKRCNTTSFVSCIPVHIAAYSDAQRNLQQFRFDDSDDSWLSMTRPKVPGPFRLDG